MSKHGFLHCVWYRSKKSATDKAKRIAISAAESLVIVKDNRTNMFGVITGNKRPEWCNKDQGFEFVSIIKPMTH